MPQLIGQRSLVSQRTARWRCDLEVWVWAAGRLTPSTFPPAGQAASPTLGCGGYHGCATWPTKSRQFCKEGVAQAWQACKTRACEPCAPGQNLIFAYPSHALVANPPEWTRKPLVCRSGISRARSFDLEVTTWAPTRLTSCIFHSGHTEAYEPLRSTRRPARAPFRDLAAPESTRKGPAHHRPVCSSVCVA